MHKNILMIIKKNPILWLVLMMTWVACEERVEAEKDATKADTLAAEVPAASLKKQAYYPIPSPEQMFNFIHSENIFYQKSLVNNPETFSDYVDPVSQALNFGVYSADLAYTATYSDVEATIELYKTIRQMSEEMNIAGSMSPEVMERIQESLVNPDSLSEIAEKTYYNAVDFLEANDMSDKLALIALGGWVESIYIALNALDEFDPNAPTIQLLADQKLTFGNLYAYINTNAGERAASVVKEIQPIRDLFASLQEKKIGQANATKKEGKLILSGGKKISMTRQQFKDLQQVITDYRKKIVDSNSN